MANINGLYNPEAEAQQDFTPLPTGDYLMQIVDSDLKPTKDNNGHYLELVMEVMDGALKGRKAWDRLNLDHPNAQAVEIANRTFSSIREATGVANPRDSQDLHYKPMIVRVESYPAGSVIAFGKRKGQTRDRDETEVRGYKKADGAVGNAPATASTPTTAPSDATPPWKRAA